MTAGIETLKAIREPGVFDQLVAGTTRLCQGIGAAAEAAGIPVYQAQAGTMFCTFFTDQPVTNWDTAAKSDTTRYARFFQAMLKYGVYLAPSQFETGFFSIAHTDEIVAATVEAAQMAFKEIA
jgi:glutamate-1-semialdehyde 2,1-aminomutase